MIMSGAIDRQLFTWCLDTPPSIKKSREAENQISANGSLVPFPSLWNSVLGSKG